MASQMDSARIEMLEPGTVWRLFADIAAVPRPSKKEGQIRKHVRTFAQEKGFKVREDAAGNTVIEVPASPGCENIPITVLQGHLDMVCEKNTGTQHDFERDPLKLIVEKDEADGQLLVRAQGTTLGADNGIGVALAMAAATSPEVTHGRLELLCTVDEEMGMTGAKALQPDFFTGKRMLNLDSEDDDTIYIGCAGGCDTTLKWEFKTDSLPTDREACRVTVAGLRGGHSGCDIQLNRVNAIKLLIQTLQNARDAAHQLVTLNGGSKRNAIPREASALVVGPAGTLHALIRAAQEVQAEAVSDCGETNCTICVDKPSAGEAQAVVAPEDTQRLLTTLTALPHGVIAVVPEIAGLIQTSNSVSTVESRLDSGVLRVEVGCLSRSSSAAQLQMTVHQLSAIGELGGAMVESGNDYPGWQPNLDSPILATCRRVYEQLFREAPKVSAIHAGLECGIIGERVGEMDMVSIGPRIVGAHSPDECVYVASVQKSWKFLTAILAELARA